MTYLCDVSDGALNHSRRKVVGHPPKTTRNAEDVCASPEVDIVMIANSDAFHATHALLGLSHNKFVFVEKPMALCQRDADLIVETEAKSSGKVMVGYMRRYAAAFLDAIKEIGSLGEIHHARVRDVTGPNSVMIGQSGTFPKSFKDYTTEDTKELTDKTNEFLHQALTEELGIPTSPEFALMWRHLGGLGSHDLSAMREVFGPPSAVLGASLCKSSGPPFWTWVVLRVVLTTYIPSVFANLLSFAALYSNTLLSLSRTSLVSTAFRVLMPLLKCLARPRLSRSVSIRPM